MLRTSLVRSVFFALLVLLSSCGGPTEEQAALFQSEEDARKVHFFSNVTRSNV